MKSIETAWTSVEQQIRAFLLKRLGKDIATVDDLVQDVFLRLSKHLPQLRSIDHLGPWTARVTRSVLIDHLRRQRPQPSSADTLATLPAVDAELTTDDPMLIALRTYAAQQIAHLPPHEQLAIRLVDLDGVSPRAAAQQLGIGLPALKARLRRGREHLREAIEQCCAISRDAVGRPLGCESTTNCGPCATSES
jgi:RNA polymerase sigma-70 factor, ECF subfamily